jgi:hypothetical protein
VPRHVVDAAGALDVVRGDPLKPDTTDLIPTRLPNPLAAVPMPVTLNPKVVRARRDRDDFDLLHGGLGLDDDLLRDRLDDRDLRGADNDLGCYRRRDNDLCLDGRSRNDNFRAGRGGAVDDNLAAATTGAEESCDASDDGHGKLQTIHGFFSKAGVKHSETAA